MATFRQPFFICQEVLAGLQGPQPSPEEWYETECKSLVPRLSVG